MLSPRENQTLSPRGTRSGRSPTSAMRATSGTSPTPSTAMVVFNGSPQDQTPVSWTRGEAPIKPCTSQPARARVPTQQTFTPYRLLPGVRCQTRQLGAQGFWFLFFSFLLPSRRAHAACKRRRTPRVCCGDHAHVHAHDEQRPQPRSPTLPPMVRRLGEKASPVGKHLLDDQPPHRMMLL